MLAAACSIAIAGCSSCGDEKRGRRKGAPEIDPARRLHDEVEARLADRRIDRDKAYPKDEKGQVVCGEDSSCFLVQVERCEPALFTHKRDNPGMMFIQRTEAMYRVAGKRSAGCALQRARVRHELLLDDATRAAFAKQGKDEAFIAKLRDEALATFLPADPPRLECVLPRDNALDLALDIADNRHLPGHFQQRGCTKPGEDRPWPSELTLPDQAEQGAALPSRTALDAGTQKAATAE